MDASQGILLDTRSLNGKTLYFATIRRLISAYDPQLDWA
jgi:hypothetical protein